MYSDKEERNQQNQGESLYTYVLHTLLWYFRSTDSQSISLPMCYINPGKSSHITVFITIGQYATQIYCISLVREGLSQPESTPLSQPESTPLSQLQKELKGKNMLFPKSSLQLGRVIGQGER